MITALFTLVWIKQGYSMMPCLQISMPWYQLIGETLTECAVRQVHQYLHAEHESD